MGTALECDLVLRRKPEKGKGGGSAPPFKDKGMNKSDLERMFLTYWRMLGPLNKQDPEEEYVFHPYRRWRFDYAWPEDKVALELQGGTWAKGRHVRGAGYRNDCEKLDEAQLLGWLVLYVTSDMLEEDPATICDWITAALDRG